MRVRDVQASACRGARVGGHGFRKSMPPGSIPNRSEYAPGKATPPFCAIITEHLGGAMISIEQLAVELSYNPDTGVLLRNRTQRPVYLESGKGGPRVEVAGVRLSAYKVVLALWLGRYPEKHEYRHTADDPTDLRAVAFKRRRGDGRKDCASCGKDVELDNYHYNAKRKDKRGSYCVDCIRQLSRQWNRTATVAKYGMSEHDYEAMSAAQGHKCRICEKPANRERYGKLSIDHCHISGAVRGLLCISCNTSLGKFYDDPRMLLRAAQYLLGKLP